MVLYPTKSSHATFEKCKKKEDVLYKDGSVGLESDVPVPTEKTIGDTSNPFQLPPGFRNKNNSSTVGKQMKVVKRTAQAVENVSSCFDEMVSSDDTTFKKSKKSDQSQAENSVVLKESCNHGVSYLNLLTPNHKKIPLSQEHFKSRGESASLKEILQSRQQQKSSPTALLCSTPVEKLPPSQKHFVLDNGSSSSEISDEEDITVGDQSPIRMENEELSLDHSDGEEAVAPAASLNKTCTLQTITIPMDLFKHFSKKMFRHIHILTQKVDDLSKEIKECRAAVEGDTLKTKTNIIPGTTLPAQNPNDLKYIDTYLSKKTEHQLEFIKFLKGKALGRKAIDVSNGIMLTVFSNYAAAHCVWDGVHKGPTAPINRKIALKSSLPWLALCLKEVMEAAAATNNVPLKEVKAGMGRFLTLAPKRLSGTDPPLQLPWTFRQEVPSDDEEN